MNGSITVSKESLNRLTHLMTANAAAARKTLVEETNQRTLNIAGRIVESVKPKGGVKAYRKGVQKYMNTQISTKVRLLKSGKNKGKFTSRGLRKNQLTRANLIAQARAKKKGFKGLYGETMHKAESAIIRRAVSSVGYLRAPFKPIIQYFNMVCKFKVPFSKTKGIGLWNIGKLKHQSRVAVQGTPTPHAGFLAAAIAPTQGDAYSAAAQAAVNAESNEIARHMKARLEKQLKETK